MYFYKKFKMFKIVKISLTTLCTITLIYSNLIKFLSADNAVQNDVLYNTEHFNKNARARDVYKSFTDFKKPKCCKRVSAETKELLFSPIKRLKFKGKNEAKELRSKLRNYSLNRLSELSKSKVENDPFVMMLFQHYVNSVELTWLQLLEKYENLMSPWDYDQSVLLKEKQEKELNEELKRLKEEITYIDKVKKTDIIPKNIDVNVANELKQKFNIYHIYAPLMIASIIQVFLLFAVNAFLPYNYRILLISLNSYLLSRAQIGFILKKKFTKLQNNEYIYGFEDPNYATRLMKIFTPIIFFILLGFNASFLVVPRLGVHGSRHHNSIFTAINEGAVNRVGFNWIWFESYLSSPFAKLFQLYYVH